MTCASRNVVLRTADVNRLPGGRTVPRSRALVIGCACLLYACGFDRERPSPVAPDATASLSVEVLAPLPGTPAFAGTTLTVSVRARDLSGDLLAGVGYVVRRSGSGNNATLDSASFGLGGAALATQEFTFAVPVLPTNTQLDIFGIAYGPGTQTRVSIPRSVLVVPCQVGQPGC